MIISLVAARKTGFTGTMSVEIEWDGTETFSLEEYIECAAKAAILDKIVASSDGWWMKKDEERIL